MLGSDASQGLSRLCAALQAALGLPGLDQQEAATLQELYLNIQSNGPLRAALVAAAQARPPICGRSRYSGATQSSQHRPAVTCEQDLQDAPPPQLESVTQSGDKTAQSNKRPRQNADASDSEGEDNVTAKRCRKGSHPSPPTDRPTSHIVQADQLLPADELLAVGQLRRIISEFTEANDSFAMPSNLVFNSDGTLRPGVVVNLPVFKFQQQLNGWTSAVDGILCSAFSGSTRELRKHISTCLERTAEVTERALEVLGAGSLERAADQVELESELDDDSPTLKGSSPVRPSQADKDTVIVGNTAAGDIPGSCNDCGRLNTVGDDEGHPVDCSRISMGCSGCIGAGAEGDPAGNGGGGDPTPAHYPYPPGAGTPEPPCNRNGVNAARDAPAIANTHELLLKPVNTQDAMTADNGRTGGRRGRGRGRARGDPTVRGGGRGRRSTRIPHDPAASPRVLTRATQDVLVVLSLISTPSAFDEVAHLVNFSTSGRDGSDPLALVDCEDNDVESLRKLCGQSNDLQAMQWTLVLGRMITDLRFALTADRIHRQHMDNGDPKDWKTLMLEWSKEIGKPVKQLEAVRHRGLRWAYVLLAGSVPVFVAIALLELAQMVVRMPVESLSQLCACLRNPDLFDGGITCAARILPAVVDWGRSFNLRMGGRLFGEDLTADDEYLSNIDFNLGNLPERCATWDDWDASGQCTLLERLPDDFQPYIPPTWVVPRAEHAAAEVVFPLLEVHGKPTAPFPMKGKKDERATWTRAEQLMASTNQIVCHNLEELNTVAGDHGATATSPYIVVSSDLARDSQRDIAFKFSNNSDVIAVLVNSDVLPKDDMDSLWAFLMQATRIRPESIPSQSTPERPSNFPALHFVHGNRFAELGDDLATNPAVAKSMQELDGNDKQRLPRLHRDIRSDLQAWYTISAGMEKIFRLVADRIKLYLPQTYELLMTYVECLPGGSWSPCAPFAGFVINFGVMCNGHVDDDLGVCVVITFGEFTGGELGLYEAKLLFALKGFSILVFPSDKFTHFNLGFKGQRGSLVLSTEKASQRYTADRNLWRSYLLHRKKELRKSS